MNTKFLPNGKKVVVCGKINKSEYIVQEVFVTDDGSEIPSGENFTTTQLLDVPAKTYADKKKEEVEGQISRLEKTKSKLLEEIKGLEYDRKVNAEWMKRNKFIKDNLEGFDWDYFSDVMMGNIKYAVGEYSPLRVECFDKVIADNTWGKGKFNSLRAIGLYSVPTKNYSTREYKFNVYCYSDGSGGRTNYTFFKDKETLSKYLKEKVGEMFSKGDLRLDHLEEVKDYIDVDSSIVDSLIESHNKSIEDVYRKALESANKILERKM